jgi:hypothetical protein
MWPPFHVIIVLNASKTPARATSRELVYTILIMLLSSILGSQGACALGTRARRVHIHSHADGRIKP